MSKASWEVEQEKMSEYHEKISNGISAKKPLRRLRKNMPSIGSLLNERLEVRNSIVDSTNATSTVIRPEILYRDNPEMLKRELAAKAVVHMVAPAYNKGGDQLVTPDLLKEIQAGGTRRRG